MRRVSWVCARSRDRLWAYLAGELKTGEASRLQRHLDRCADCRNEAEAARQTMVRVEQLREAPLPSSEAGWEDLCYRIDRMEAVPILPRRRYYPGMVFALSGAALVLATLWFVVGRASREERSSKTMAANPAPFRKSENPDGDLRRTAPPLKEKGGESLADRETAPPSDDEQDAASNLQPATFRSRAKTLGVNHATRGLRRRTRRRRHRRPVLEVAPQRQADQEPKLRLAQAVDGDRPTFSGPPTCFILASMSNVAQEPVQHEYVMGNIDVATQGAQDKSRTPSGERNIW